MAKNFGSVLNRFLVFLAFVCVPIGFISCDSSDDSSTTTAAGSAPASTPLATPAPQPTVVILPTLFPVPVPVPDPRLLLPGEYGGDNALVTFDGGGVQFKFACGIGRITRPLEADLSGDFDVSGIYQSQSGPVPVGGFPEFQARYFGYIDNGHLHFDVSYKSGESGSGGYVDYAYDVYFGESPRFTDVCADITPLGGATVSPTPSPSP